MFDRTSTDVGYPCTYDLHFNGYWTMLSPDPCKIWVTGEERYIADFYLQLIFFQYPPPDLPNAIMVLVSLITVGVRLATTPFFFFLNTSVTHRY
jgi:hypothetical protein